MLSQTGDAMDDLQNESAGKCVVGKPAAWAQRGRCSNKLYGFTVGENIEWVGTGLFGIPER